MRTKPPHRDILDNRPQHPEIPRDPMPGLPYPDIFSAPPKLPKKVYIVGSGPRGEDAFKTIPEDACTIALNSMISQWRPWTYWMAFDYRIVDSDFWCEIKVPKKTVTLFGARLANRVWSDPAVFPKIKPNYYFRYHPGMSGASFVEGQPCLVDGLLRGLTVAGCALQFAYWFGATEIVLCGIDMFGQNHLDGHVNIDVKYLAEWPWSKNLSRLCGVLRSKGISICSLSPTNLEVPLCRP
jgi:hypothetical protein